MIGTPASLTVRVSRKLGDEAYGSYGVEAEITVNLPADAKLNEAFDAADSWLTAAVARSIQDKTEEVQKARPKSEEPGGEAETKQEKAEGKEETFQCVKFTLAKLPDKKFRLELYPKIKDAPGKFPTIKFTAEREKMWDMLHDVADDYDFSDLPVEYTCEWLVHYAIGREFEIKQGEHKGEKSHYKDLLAIKSM